MEEVFSQNPKKVIIDDGKDPIPSMYVVKVIWLNIK